MKKLFLTGLILCSFVYPCSAGAQVKKDVKKGNLLYNKGKFEEALKKYEKALSNSPDSEVVNFNFGAALYKTKDYKKAIGHFKKSLVSEDRSLEQKASYNIGNAKYKYGISKEGTDLPKAIRLLKQALRHYERAIELDPEDGDAKYNYDFVEKEIERLEKKLKQQQNQKQQGEQKKPQQSRPEEKKESGREEKNEEEQPQDKDEDRDREQQAAHTHEPEETDSEEEQPSGQTTEAEQMPQEMSEKEALMLLENYRQEEEPKGLYKEKIPTRRLPKVMKDW